MALKYSEMMAALMDCMYVHSLGPKEKAKYYLILRYKSKISERLKSELPVLIQQGKKLYEEEMSRIIMQASFFGKAFIKSDWQGATLPLDYDRKT